MDRAASLVPRTPRRRLSVETRIFVKLLRSFDWPFRHFYFARIRKAPHRARLVQAIKKAMGPDELLDGKNKGRFVPEGWIIPLPDKKRTKQLTLHDFFRSAKQNRMLATRKPMRQLTLHAFFKKC